MFFRSMFMEAEKSVERRRVVKVLRNTKGGHKFSFVFLWRDIRQKKKRYMSEVNNKDQKVNEPFHLARVLTNCSWQMQTRGNDGVLLLENLSGVSAHENDPYENNTFLVVRWTRL